MRQAGSASLTNSMDKNGIVCEDLTFRYSQTSKYEVISHASLFIEQGRVTVISGSSGCGKSTLLYLMAGIYPQNAGVVDSGRVLVEGQEIGELEPSERMPLVGMMFQNPDLQFCMDTVENELVFCLENKGEDPADMQRQMDEALAFCGISHLKEKTLYTLSGGEKQKVMLACVTLLRPKWLLLDEPFANIDPASTAELVQKLGKLHEELGIGIVAVDHQVAHWLPILDEVVLLGAGGELLSRGITRDNLKEYRQTFEELGIVYPGQSYREPVRRAPVQDEPVLSIRGLCAGYGETAVLCGLDADFYRGRAYAVTGLSGSGKSTLFSVLCGLVPYQGSVQLEGKELKKLRKKALAHKLGFVFQNPQDQFVAGSVFDEIAVSLKKRGREEELEERVKAVLQEIGLWKYRFLSPFMLSQGQQRRLAVAALLAYDCEILVCDEPTYAQDLRAIRAVMELLERRVGQGLTLIFSTHDKQLGCDYADELYVLEDGKLKREELP